MGAYGNPKLLCPDCAELVETASFGKEYDEIKDAMDRLTARMSAANVDDRFTIAALTDLLRANADRAQRIKDGTYDFSLDEQRENEGMDEIPEELRETEEDKKLDEKEAEANARFDKFMNWTWIGVGIGALGFIIYKLIDILFLK